MIIWVICIKNFCIWVASNSFLLNFLVWCLIDLLNVIHHFWFINSLVLSWLYLFFSFLGTDWYFLPCIYFRRKLIFGWCINVINLRWNFHFIILNLFCWGIWLILHLNILLRILVFFFIITLVFGLCLFAKAFSSSVKWCKRLLFFNIVMWLSFFFKWVSFTF